MNPHEIYLEARRLGLHLEPRGDKLAIIPKGKCPPEFRDVLKAHKREILAWLTTSRTDGGIGRYPAEFNADAVETFPPARAPWIVSPEQLRVWYRRHLPGHPRGQDGPLT